MTDAALVPDVKRDGVMSIAYPPIFEDADVASRAGQLRTKRLAGGELVLLVAAAAVATTQGILPGVLDVRWDRALAAALLFVAFVARVANRLTGADDEWFDGRAVAETIKSAAWKYAVHAYPYDGDDRAADVAFYATVRDTLEARQDLAACLHQGTRNGSQITPWMRSLRSAPLAERSLAYLAERVDDQAAWYAARTEGNRRAAGRWFWLGLGFEIVAVLVAIGLVVATSAPDVVGVLATLAVAVTAWNQTGRHDELSKSYGLAANEIVLLRTRVEMAGDEESFGAAVNDVELAVSREHTMWMARRS
ncbi:MAG: DUF4231 domain-containing protein [Chloroflexota bacterium]|nr:DUF4231 domain-containing protein [Chloroflexota bacterium]